MMSQPVHYCQLSERIRLDAEMPRCKDDDIDCVRKAKAMQENDIHSWSAQVSITRWISNDGHIPGRRATNCVFLKII